MRLSEEVLEQVGVAVNIFLAFVGIEIKDHLNYQFDFNYDQTKPGLK